MDWIENRTPFSGRNEEYYSEDSNVNYMLERLFYLQSRNEELLQDKAFLWKDFETQRGGISYFYREQAFREGSLRGFEGAAK